MIIIGIMSLLPPFFLEGGPCLETILLASRAMQTRQCLGPLPRMLGEAGMAGQLGVTRTFSTLSPWFGSELGSWT